MTARLLKRGVRSVSRSGVFSAFAALIDSFVDTRENLLRVVTYHRIAEPSNESLWNPITISATPEEFRRQLKYLASRSRVLSLQDVLAAVDGESTLPPRSVLITFDDARQDFLSHAVPALVKEKLPATLFVPTGFPDNEQQAFWWERIYRCVHANAGQRSWHTPIGPFRLESQHERQSALTHLTRHYERLPLDEAEVFLKQLCESASLETPGNDVLSWEDLRQLARNGVTLGAHTRTHPLLNRASPEQAQYEIQGSIDDLKREIGVAPEAFAYPGGALTDDTVDAVAEAGIRLAFTTCRGTNNLDGLNPLRIRRINIGRTTSVSVLRLEMRPAFRFLNSFWSRRATDPPAH